MFVNFQLTRDCRGPPAGPSSRRPSTHQRTPPITTWFMWVKERDGERFQILSRVKLLLSPAMWRCNYFPSRWLPQYTIDWQFLSFSSTFNYTCSQGKKYQPITKLSGKVCSRVSLVHSTNNNFLDVLFCLFFHAKGSSFLFSALQV